MFDLKASEVYRFPRGEWFVQDDWCTTQRWFLEEESEDLPSEVLPPGLLVVHDPAGGGHHHEPELPGWQQVGRPLLNVSDSNVESERIDVVNL